MLIGKVKRGERTKPELIDELKNKGVELPHGMNHSKIDLQQFTKDTGIALFVERPVKKLGWTGTRKGLTTNAREQQSVTE
jgi:hypothetical protein